jgi:outer membrane protein insertion porin family
MTTKEPQFIPFVKISIALFAIILFTGCAVVPRNYPKNKPFVFETNITVEGDMSKEEKGRLESQLANQLDDSVQARTGSGFLKSILKNPPAYDSSAVGKSKDYMQLLLKSSGYYYSVISDTHYVRIKGDQQRTTVNFLVKTGKLITLDSVTYKMENTELQKITQDNAAEAIVKKGDAFAKGPMSAERDRLVTLYRNNGYLRFTSNEVIGLWDTLDVALLQPNFDPFEQIALLEKLKARQEKPTANLEYRLKPEYDNSKLTKYYIGKITVYPDINPETVNEPKKTVALDSGNLNIIYSRYLFKPRFLKRNIYLQHGDLYRQNVLVKTIDRFNSLASWKLVNIEPVTKIGSDTVDFKISLSPADKYSYGVTLEGNNSQSSITGRLWGIGLNLDFQDRNTSKSANHSVTNFRYGVEFGNKKGIQTQQLTASHNIYFPRLLVAKYVPIPIKWRENAKTVFAFGAGLTDRIDYFNQRSVNMALGYESNWNKTSVSVRIPNIEYSSLIKRDSLIKLISLNPILKNLFTDGLIVSIAGKWDLNWGKPTRLNFFRFNVEESGLLTGIIKNKFLDTNLYRYIKIEAEISRKEIYKKWADGTDKTVLVLRMMGGVGYELGSTGNPDKRNNLPFFKAFFAGGPNSMRAWQLRRLGPGSLIENFDGTGGTPERFGDVQLEANIEYRFHLFKFGIAKVNGALFTDVGNIWYLKEAAAPGKPESVFNFSRLWKDLAVGMGGGLRIDFSLFILRLDYSYKAKDPSPSLDKAASQNKWFYNIKPLNGTFQLGINYPFVL